MTKTLLLDLDDTLLVNDIDAFLPVYLSKLSEVLSPYAEPKKMVATLLAATKRMVQNERPDCTLKDVFDSAFYPVLGLNALEMAPLLETFYAEVFPSLQYLTQPRPEAVAMVEAALERGYQLAVTTNPLFPQAAMRHRLAWAGLPVEQYPFRFVTSYENFHFSKPHPAFYAEVLAQLGWPEGPVVVVGDSLENDIQAAQQLGLANYWLPGTQTAVPARPPSGQGRVEGLLDWIDQQDEAELQPKFTSPSAFLAILNATPAALHTLAQATPSERWALRPQSEEWSLTEILAHLRDVDQEVNLPRLRKALQEENPFIPGVDTDPWANERLYIRQNGSMALQRFIHNRMELLELLKGLQPADWQRQVRHALLGPTLFSELVSIIAAHDRLHIQQAQAAAQA